MSYRINSSFTRSCVAQVFLHSGCIRQTISSDGWFELCSKRGIMPSAAQEHSSIKATPVAHLLQGALLWPPHVSSDNHQASTFFIINNKRVVEVSASGSEPSGRQRSNSCGIRLQRARASRRNKLITMSPSCHGDCVAVGCVWSSVQMLFQGFKFSLYGKKHEAAEQGNLLVMNFKLSQWKCICVSWKSAFSKILSSAD